ncbi:acyltransferase family protein [Sanguibacter antarcticus]|uniref:Peptidoglycan/LPS O-acetylase OafA/YrhL n=1 Tax=Sanguibacter antarcticus TaxID=372484 RepID=A0A2A9E6N0_9MICO|nr:acyltransferase family protein [Sanguibacter antarcticus]PFG34306.1 peptidoglycan/LPS O-acetylase OafA/YrhL [Sanguibacter antarcticus]
MRSIEARTIPRRPAPQPPAAPRAFSPEIQALRALAVVGVVVYHLWPGLLRGGFVGVDVFFVISGYLITTHMLREHTASGRIDLAAFYARRARRIIPAASLVVLATVVLGALVLPESRWHSLTHDATASLLYYQNWALAAGSVDYLSEGQAPSLFQHYWSLSVEEQFYLVWPGLCVVVIALGARLRLDSRRVVLAVLLVLGAASFVVSVHEVRAGSPAAYFTTTTRFWELALGAALAFAPTLRRSSTTALVVSNAGFVGLVTSMLVIGPGWDFPGAVAVWPTVSTALVILGAEQTRPWSFRWIVRERLVQRVGDISYSLYLWHWPLLVLVPFVLPGWASAPRLLVALVASLVLADLTRRFVEKPFQRTVRRGTTSRQVLMVTVTATLVCVLVVQVPGLVSETRATDREAAAATLLQEEPPGLGAGSLALPSFRTFLDGRNVIAPVPEDARTDLPTGADGRCKSDMGAPTTPRCDFGAPDADLVVALVGDSHMEQYLPAFERLAEQHPVRVVTYLHSSCPFSTAQRASDEARGGACLQANEATLERLQDDPSIDLVVTSSRTAVDWVVSPERPAPAEGFAELWTSLADSGLPVVVLKDNPLMLPDDGTLDCVSEHRADPEQCGRDLDAAMPTDHQVEAAAMTPSVRFVDTTSWFCTTTFCPTVVGSVLVYRDDQHLTVAYAETLAPMLWKEVRETVA